MSDVKSLTTGTGTRVLARLLVAGGGGTGGRGTPEFSQNMGNPISSRHSTEVMAPSLTPSALGNDSIMFWPFNAELRS